MFPLDDLVIVPGYSLDSMGFGERTVEKISPSMAESYEMVETSMCVPEQPKKKKEEGENTRDKDQNLRSVPEIKNENDNPAVPDDQKAEVEGDKGVLQNLVNLGYDFLSLFSTPQ